GGRGGAVRGGRRRWRPRARGSHSTAASGRGRDSGTAAVPTRLYVILRVAVTCGEVRRPAPLGRPPPIRTAPHPRSRRGRLVAYSARSRIHPQHDLVAPGGGRDAATPAARVES